MIDTRIMSVQRPGIRSVRITGGFWKNKVDMAAHSMVPYQWDALNDVIPGAVPSHALENFRIAAGEVHGSFSGNIWQDSDVAKWLEAASYSLMYNPDSQVEARIDEAVRLIEKAQLPDGYINTYFSVVSPEKRWTDLAWAHELYCAGHLIEAAVARFEVTGKRDLLDVMCRAADHIERTFGPGENRKRGCCGHPEIELALFRLYGATGETRYRDLAIHFINERGTDPDLFRQKEPNGFVIDIQPTRWYMQPDYFCARKPVRSQRDAEGHSVRAMYLYSAMADAYLETHEPGLLEALKALWESAVSRRMYITGGLGSQAHAERFTVDYDLPSDTAYAETCASIGLAFWASRMSAIEPDSRYADAVERVIYNGVLSGVSLDGTRYFYVNPLEVVPSVAANRHDHAHIKTARVAWFGCSCCPPNMARLIGSIGSYLYSQSGDEVWVHQYMESEASLEQSSGSLRIRQETSFPWEGGVRFILRPDREREVTLHLRIPGWCESFSLSVNGAPLPSPRIAAGYCAVSARIKPGDVIELSLDMPVRIMSADPRVAELAGKAAIQRGPLVYCLESVDNGPDLHQIVLDPHGSISPMFDPLLMGGIVSIDASGFRIAEEKGNGGSRPAGAGVPGTVPPHHDGAPASRSGDLYRRYPDGGVRLSPVRLRAVPYHTWGNRSPNGEMRVWLRIRD